MTSDNSHSTCGYKSLGPMDLCMSGFFKCPLTQPPPLRVSLLASGFHSGFRGLGLQKAGLTIKNWVKQGIHYLLFLYFSCHQCAYLIQSGPTLFLLLSLLDCLLVRMDLSWARKSIQFSWTPLQGCIPWDSAKQTPEENKGCSPEILGWCLSLGPAPSL